MDFERPQSDPQKKSHVTNEDEEKKMIFTNYFSQSYTIIERGIERYKSKLIGCIAAVYYN